MAVSTQSLQVRWFVVPTITVYVVYIELTAMCRNEATMQAGVLLVDGVWILVLLYVSFVDSFTAKATSGS